MERIARERRIDNPTLAANVGGRRSFAVGERVLIWQEHIMAKRKLGNGRIKFKLRKTWSRALVLEKCGRNYVCRSFDEGNTIKQ